MLLDGVNVKVLGNRVEEADGRDVDAREQRALVDGDVGEAVDPVDTTI